MDSSSPSDTRHNPHGIDAILARRNDQNPASGGSGSQPLVTSVSGRDCWQILHHLHRQLQFAAASAHAATSLTANEASSSGSSETETATASNCSNIARAGKGPSI